MFAFPLFSKLPPIVKGLAPAGLAFALAAGLHTAQANATDLESYYRTMYVMKFCSVPTSGEEESGINVAVEQEIVDNGTTSEDIAPIFDRLNSEYNADPVAFCSANTGGAEQVLDQF